MNIYQDVNNSVVLFGFLVFSSRSLALKIQMFTQVEAKDFSTP